MGMNLILWKAPVVDDPDEAARLLEPYYKNGDDSARRFPEGIEGPWGGPTAGKVDRVLFLSMPWGVSDTIIDAIAELARKHELVLYDPQGPDITLPTDPIHPEPTSQP